MIVVVVIGILAAIAVPMYGDSVTRSKIIEGTTQLGDMRTQMEKFFMDNRTYLGGGPGGCGVANPPTRPSTTISRSPAQRWRARRRPISSAPTGNGARGMAGFLYTVDQANAKTSAGPGGKYTNAACWAVRKDGSC